MSYTLPKLGYGYDALEPYFDARTMEIHHTKHHNAYVTNLNAALESNGDWSGHSPEDLIRNLNSIPENIRTAVRNHGGGHVNHAFFWQILKKDVAYKGEVAEAINAKFGSLQGFQDGFFKTAMGVFGSGWAWLVVDKNGELAFRGTPNQDNPMTNGERPILGLDVWEHAYYLKYQNVRPDYIKAAFNLFNWKKINEFYVQTLEAVKSR
ncbi:MAG: superoxide dismutase [Candidatus Zixiibacteriota bacterium]